VVDEANWVINNELPKNDDGLGNINNFFDPSPKPNPRTVMKDIRQIRSLLNKVHIETTREDAEIFLHQ
jgi:hypothetical protein